MPIVVRAIFWCNLYNEIWILGSEAFVTTLLFVGSCPSFWSRSWCCRLSESQVACLVDSFSLAVITHCVKIEPYGFDVWSVFWMETALIYYSIFPYQSLQLFVVIKGQSPIMSFSWSSFWSPSLISWLVSRWGDLFCPFEHQTKEKKKGTLKLSLWNELF